MKKPDALHRAVIGRVVLAEKGGGDPVEPVAVGKSTASACGATRRQTGINDDQSDQKSDQGGDTVLSLRHESLLC